MITRQIHRQLQEIFAKSERVLLVAHQKPDGDTLGACTALADWLYETGKSFQIFCLDLPGSNYSFLNHFQSITNDKKVFAQKFDLIAVLDSGSLSYCGIDKLLKKGSVSIVNIDHHRGNDMYGDLNVVDIEASSTCQIVADFFQENGIALNPARSTSLMTGIMNDTSYFTNAATSASSIEITSGLISTGARTSEITLAMHRNKTATDLKLWGAALSRLRHDPSRNLAFTYLKQEDLKEANAKPQATEGLINFLNAVCGGAEILMILTQAGDNLVKGSFRSVDTDVLRLAKLLGGGGHRLAAGFSIQGKIVETDKGIGII